MLPYEDLIFLSLSNSILKNKYSSFSDTAELLHNKYICGIINVYNINLFKMHSLR